MAKGCVMRGGGENMIEGTGAFAARTHLSVAPTLRGEEGGGDGSYAAGVPLALALGDAAICRYTPFSGMASYVFVFIVLRRFRRGLGAHQSDESRRAKPRRSDERRVKQVSDLFPLRESLCPEVSRGSRTLYLSLNALFVCMLPVHRLGGLQHGRFPLLRASDVRPQHEYRHREQVAWLP